MSRFDDKKRCCSICDERSRCHVCKEQTQTACADCQIDFGVTANVCTKKTCRDSHELKCPGVAREREALFETQISDLKSELESVKISKTVSQGQ